MGRTRSRAITIFPIETFVLAVQEGSSAVEPTHQRTALTLHEAIVGIDSSITRAKFGCGLKIAVIIVRAFLLGALAGAFCSVIGLGAGVDTGHNFLVVVAFGLAQVLVDVAIEPAIVLVVGGTG